MKQRDAPDTSGRMVSVMIDIFNKQNWGREEKKRGGQEGRKTGGGGKWEVGREKEERERGRKF